MNAYDLMQDLGDLLGEAVGNEVHWSARQKLRTLNRVQQRYYMKMSMTLGDWFVKKSSPLTPVAGSITLPDDCAKPIYLEEVSSSREIPIVLSVRERALYSIPEYTAWDGQLAAYLMSNTVEVNKSSYVTPVYLWYDRRCIDMHAGTGAAGSGLVGSYGKIVLEANLGHNVVNNYYNGLSMDIISGTGAGRRVTISDYTGSTRSVITDYTLTFDTDTVYGIVSILPDESYDAVLQRAYISCLSKAAGVISEEFLKAALSDARDAENTFFEWVQTRVKNTQYTSVRE